MSRRSNKISGQFAPRHIEMLESFAYRVLSRSALQVIARIEIEMAHHGGNDNGRLPVTLADFVRYGVDRQAIEPAIREAIALGFIEITERGRGGNGDFRRPNKFRLTFRPAQGFSGDGSHEWRRIANDPQATIRENLATAKEIARRARDAKNTVVVEKARKAYRRRQSRAPSENIIPGGEVSTSQGGKATPKAA